MLEETESEMEAVLKDGLDPVEFLKLSREKSGPGRKKRRRRKQQRRRLVAQGSQYSRKKSRKEILEVSYD